MSGSTSDISMENAAFVAGLEAGIAASIQGVQASQVRVISVSITGAQGSGRLLSSSFAVAVEFEVKKPRTS
eukprot:3241555-Amphidinium_carterae.1